MGEPLFKARFSKRQVTKRAFSIQLPGQSAVSNQNAAVKKTPEKQVEFPVPYTPTPGEMSVSFLASTPKPGRPQLSRRRPASTDPSPDVLQLPKVATNKVDTLSSKRDKIWSSKSSPLVPGGSVEEKMASIARTRLEKKHRKESGSAGAGNSFRQQHSLHGDSQELDHNEVIKTAPSKAQVKHRQKVSVSVMDEEYHSNMDQSAASVYKDKQHVHSINNTANKSNKSASSQTSKNNVTSGKCSQDIRSYILDKSSNQATVRKRSASTDNLSVEHMQSSNTFTKDASLLFKTRRSVESINNTGIVDRNNNSPFKRDRNREFFNRNETKEPHTSRNMSNNSRIKQNSIVNNFQTIEKVSTSTAKSKQINSNETVTQTPRIIKTKRVAIQNAKDLKSTKTVDKDHQQRLPQNSLKQTTAANENSRKRKMSVSATKNPTKSETIGSLSKKRSVEAVNVSGIRQLAKRTTRQLKVNRSDASVNDDMVGDGDDRSTRTSPQGTHTESLQPQQKQSKRGPVDVDIVLDMVTGILESHMDDCESEVQRSALKLWKKYLTEDMTALVNDVHNVASIQKEVKMSQHHIKQKQKQLMHIQNERMQLELEVRPAEKQADRNKALTAINRFLSDLRRGCVM